MKVAVLMATYNGEKYLSEQLKSIMEQTYENMDVYIRDDGSTDRTPVILQEFSTRYHNLHIINGSENLGYPECFYALTDMGIEADCYMFSDQDDVWFKDKVERAVNCLKKENDNLALCYFSGYEICDENLNIIRHSDPVKGQLVLRNTLYEVCGLEFTMALNKVALDMLNSHKPRVAKARGTWMCMLFSAFGKIICDNEPSAFYRRHFSAVTNSNVGFFGSLFWRISNFFINDGLKDYRLILKDLYNVIGDELSPKDKKTLKTFANDRYFSVVFAKVFYPHRLRRRLFDELSLRAVFLFGKL